MRHRERETLPCKTMCEITTHSPQQCLGMRSVHTEINGNEVSFKRFGPLGNRSRNTQGQKEVTVPCILY